MRAPRLRLLAGAAGPVVFTAAWALAARQQDGYSVALEHISGLAAPDARRPLVMVAGFTTLGACAAAFAPVLEAALGGPRRAGPGPTLVRVGGWAAMLAGLLRRDRMLLHPPGAPAPPSWHNRGHDAASAVAYAALVAAPLALAHRFADEPGWRVLRLPAFTTSALTAGLLGLFVSRIVEPYNGVVQRIAVTVPAAAMVSLAVWLASRGPDGGSSRR